MGAAARTGSRCHTSIASRNASQMNSPESTTSASHSASRPASHRRARGASGVRAMTTAPAAYQAAVTRATASEAAGPPQVSVPPAMARAVPMASSTANSTCPAMST